MCKLNEHVWYLLCLVLTHVVHCSSAASGTHPNLSTIIKGRCLEYKYFSELSHHEDFSVTVRCDNVWNKFKSAFAHRNMCGVTEESYDGLFELLKDKRKSDQILFWSGTKEIAHDFSDVNDNYVTLEDTFAGYIADKLQWCGCTGVSHHCVGGINYRSCAGNCKDGRGGFINKPYWSRASRRLAEKAVDTAYVIVNGTATGYFTAYWNGSIFGKTELPRLGSLGQLKKLVILVALDVNVPPKEKCGQGTLVQLVDDAKRYGIPNVECNDNPVMVLGILCAKFPRAERCKRKVESKSLADISIAFIVLTVIFIVTTIVLLVALYMFVCRPNRKTTSNNCSEPNSTATEQLMNRATDHCTEKV